MGQREKALRIQVSGVDDTVLEGVGGVIVSTVSKTVSHEDNYLQMFFYNMLSVYCLGICDITQSVHRESVSEPNVYRYAMFLEYWTVGVPTFQILSAAQATVNTFK